MKHIITYVSHMDVVDTCLAQPATCDKPKMSCAKRSEKTKSHKQLTRIAM